MQPDRFRRAPWDSSRATHCQHRTAHKAGPRESTPSATLWIGGWGELRRGRCVPGTEVARRAEGQVHSVRRSRVGRGGHVAHGTSRFHPWMCASYATLAVVRAYADDGRELNAEFTVEPDGVFLSLVLESAGGTSGSDRSRNPDYVPALRVLLGRLGERHAVLKAALVASKPAVAALAEADRMLVAVPRNLADESDIERLRLEITTAQGRVGKPAGAPNTSNNRKRLQLRLDVPGYHKDDAGRLAADLAGQRSTNQRVLPEARELLESLIGTRIQTATGRSNTVLGFRGPNVLVGTDRSPEGQLVEINDVQRGLDLLAEHGTTTVSVDELGHRSSFIGAVLAKLPNTDLGTNTTTVSFTAPTDAETADDIHYGTLDSFAKIKVRQEQARLRKLLAGDRVAATCALCGHTYPATFLVAAHIKKRAICTEDERRNLSHVAMLACTFGCDALYEAGWIAVDAHGDIQTFSPDQAPGGTVRDRIQHLHGLRCTAHDQASEPYFSWHRANVFRGSAPEV